MGANFPDAAVLRTVLDLATRAPSIDESQPWRWRVGPAALHLFADPGRLLPAGGEAGNDEAQWREILLGCGAALHHCTVALAALGWHAKVHRLPDPADPRHLAALELTPRPAGELDVVLASAIARRRTDSRHYGSWPVAWGDIALMGARAARSGVMLRQIESRTTGADKSVTVALGTGSDDDCARLRAGEATSLVVLSATAMGLASCALTEPLATGASRESARTEVFGGSGYPQSMVRMGWAAFDAEPLPAPPRRPLSDVADWLLPA